MAALELLKELTEGLSSASTTEDIGKALIATSRHFGLTTALIVDMTRLFNSIGPAIAYATSERSAIEVVDAKKPFMEHPFTVQAFESDKPFVMSQLRAVRSGTDDEAWWADLPAHLRDTDGLVVPVHRDGKLAWYVGFAGKNADLSQRTQALMSGAVHAAYARFRELLDDKTPKSPLSPRESQCLKWVSAGKSDFEVGQILTISPRTVRFHINNAKTKLGVRTRIQAVTKRLSGAA